MTLPGPVITQRDQTPPRSIPTDTGVWFAAGLTEKGPATATPIRSMSAFETTYGGRVSYSPLFDCVEVFFREGGSTVYIARVLGPAPVLAHVSLKNNTAADTLKIEAKSAGEHGNDLSVEVVAGENTGDFVLIVSDADGELERSYNLTSTLDAISWSALSNNVTASELPGTGNPIVAAAAPLTGGADDRTNVTNLERTGALDQFAKDLGPGQVSIPGGTHVDIHTALLTHAKANNRKALLDAPDTASASTIAACATAIRGLQGHLDREGAFFAPWVVISGYLGTSTPRVVPCSAAEAGLIGRVDALGNPSVPAAGENGVLRSATGFTAEFSDADRETLNDSGINVARMVYGIPKTYGYRTIANQQTSPLHWMFSTVRLDMAITARAEAIAERYVFTVIDGKRLIMSHFGAELSAMLLEFYPHALYGATPDEAFRVDVGPGVNTDQSISEGKLRAVLSIRRAPFAEIVEIEIVKVQITDRV